MMSLPVWLPGPIFLPGSLCPEESLSWGVSVLGGLCPGGSLSWVVSVLGGLCPGSLSRGALSRQVSVQGGSCPGGLCLGIPVRETPQTETHHTVKSGWYASYWNAFLCSRFLQNLVPHQFGGNFPGNVLDSPSYQKWKFLNHKGPRKFKWTKQVFQQFKTKLSSIG